MTNRKQRRSVISDFILHSKSFIKEKEQLKETILDDGSIKFYIEGFASTEVQDGSGDIVKVEGIDTTRYELNPVLQRGHKRGSENTIGKVIKIEKISGKGMWIGADIILNPEIEEHKSIIHGLRHGLINGFSIGFREVKSMYDDMKNANIIEELELFEISLVDIPDNPLTVRKFIDKIISKEGEVENQTEEITNETEIQEEIIEEVEVQEEITEEKPLETVGSNGDENTETEEKSDELINTQSTEENTQTDEVKDEVITEVEKEEVIDEVVEEIQEEKSLETKMLGISDLSVGDMVYFRTMYEYNEASCIYPELDDKPRIGYIFGIKVVGTALVGRGEFKEATMEEPIIYILEYIEVNGTLVPTAMTSIDCIEKFMIEGKYDGTMKVIYVPNTKILDENISNSNNDGNVIEVKNDEESEKNVGNDIIIKAYEDEKLESEKMLSDMISVNQKLLAKNKSLETIIEKVRKTKSLVGFHYEGQNDLGTSKLASIVSQIKS